MDMMPSLRQREPTAADANAFAQWYERAAPQQRAIANAREGVFTRRTDTLDRGHGQPNIQVQHRHIRAGLLPEERDPYAEWDLMVAKAITRVLLSQYRGHFWVVECNRKQGIAWISIPLLLGEWKHVFRLSEDITPADIIRAGGEILERFNIPRSNLDVASFIAAKNMAVKPGGAPPS